MELTTGQIQAMKGKDVTPAQARVLRKSGWQPQEGTLDEWLEAADRLQVWLVIAGMKKKRADRVGDDGDAVVYKFADYVKADG